MASVGPCQVYVKGVLGICCFSKDKSEAHWKPELSDSGSQWNVQTSRSEHDCKRQTVHKMDTFQRMVKRTARNIFWEFMCLFLRALRAGISRLFWWRWIISSSSDRRGRGSASPAGILLSCTLTKSAVCPDVPWFLTERTLLQLDAPNAQQQGRKRAVLVILNW